MNVREELRHRVSRSNLKVLGALAWSIMGAAVIVGLRDIWLASPWFVHIENAAIFFLGAYLAWRVHIKTMSPAQSHHWSVLIYSLLLLKVTTLVAIGQSREYAQTFIVLHLIGSVMTFSRPHYVINLILGSVCWAFSLRLLGYNPFLETAFLPALIGGVIVFAINQHILRAALLARMELQKSEADTRSFLELAQCFIHHVDANGHFLFVNAYWMHQLGYEPDEVKTMNLSSIISPKFRDKHQHLIRSVSSGEHMPNAQSEFVTKTGVIIPVDGAAHLVRQPNGSNVLQGIYINRSERERVILKLRESEQRFRSLAENVQEAFWLYDVDDQKVLYINQAIRQLTGYGPDEWQHHADHLLQKLVFSDDRDEVYSVLRDMRHGKDLRKELRINHPDGTEHWVSLVTSATMSETGHRHVIGLSLDITESKRIQRQMESLSRLDGLTGIANRRVFDETLYAEFHRHARESHDLALLMMDVDFFKQFNDRYGHVDGDHCLKQIAQIIQSTLMRPADIITRYGGEEFAAILPLTDGPGACAVAANIRNAIVNANIPHHDSAFGRVTMSIGVACIVPTSGISPSHLIELADAALYRAKRSGRNQICMETLLDHPINSGEMQDASETDGKVIDINERRMVGNK